MAAAMEGDEFPTLATASATRQSQRRLTTLRPPKRPKPNDAEDGQESHLPEKAPAQVAAITTQEGRQAASLAGTPTQVSMRPEERQEEGSSHIGHISPVAPSQAAAAEVERVVDSGERGNQANIVQAAAASNEVAATGKKSRRTACKGPQGEWRFSLKAKSGEETSTATCSEWWNMKGDEDDARHGREALQFAGDKTPSSPVEQHMSKKA
ncbi:hypothetical protein MRX96_018058 [Rhipicephalus microplus]